MVFDWPNYLTPQTLAWHVNKAGVQFRSPIAGSVESVEFPGAYWSISLTIPPTQLRRGSAGLAFFNRLAGGVERVLVPYWPQLIPAGTMRGSPTLAAIAARGALSMQITTAGGLKAGDMIGVGTQVFQVFQDCDAVSGTLTVPLVNRVRADIASGTPVVWSSPTVTALLPAMTQGGSFQPGQRDPIAVDLEEA